MRAWTKVVVAVVLLAVVTVLAKQWFRDKEPPHNSKTLLEWYGIFRENEGAIGETAEQNAHEAANAIRAIGINALPHLVSWIQAESPGQFGQTVLMTFGRIPWLGQWFAEIVYRPGNRADEATGIFALLGSQAAPAIPDLHKIALTTSKQEVLDRAIYCLSTVGESALPALSDLLKDDRSLRCKRTLYWLGSDRSYYFSTNISVLMPQIRSLTTNADPGVAEYATKAAGMFRVYDDTVLPALTNVLFSPHSGVRREAIWALAKFDDPALLTPALDHFDSSVRSTASNLLQRLMTPVPSPIP